MIQHKGCPEEVVKAKRKDISDLFLKIWNNQWAQVDASKYKWIRIYERKKMWKKLRWLWKWWDEGEDVEAEITHAYGELNYVLHFPPTKIYISLFPKEPYDEATL